jgi:hypothetical protein
VACCGVSLPRAAGFLVRRVVEKPFRTESGSAMIPGLEGLHSGQIRDHKQLMHSPG